MRVSAESLAENQEYTVGRCGLKIPLIDERYARMNPSYKFHRFLSALWELNGYDISKGGYDPSGRFGKIPRTFRYEFVLPPADADPLTILATNYEFLGDKDRWHSRDEYGVNNIRVEGRQDFSIAVPPEKMGPFAPIIDLSLDITSGSGHPNAFPEPRLYAQGRLIERYDFIGPPGGDWQGTEKRFGEAVDWLLEGTVELLSR